MSIILSSNLIHYFSIGLSTVITAMSVALSQAKLSKASLDAINRQPAAKSDLSRAAVLGLAIVETSALLGFIGSILLYFYEPQNIYQSIAGLGYSLAISVPGFIIAIASSMPAQAALLSMSKQLFISKKIMNLMLLTQSLIQTPAAFGFIIALIIMNQLSSINTLPQAFAILASALSIGIGSIGPGLGVGYFTQVACKGIGLNRFAYSKLISFTVISQAIIETPVIFAVIIAFWLLSLSSSTIQNPIFAIVYLAVPFVIGLGTLGAGLGSARAAAAACKQIVANPQIYSSISRTSLIAQGIIDTAAIYAFIIALAIILKIT